VINRFTPINPPLTEQTPAPPRLAPPAVAGGPRPEFIYTEPVRRGPRRPRTTGQRILQGFSYAHYGNFGGWPVKVLWVILGFAPPALFVTGLMMWWNRVVRPAARRLLKRPQASAGEPELEQSRPAVT
jgi:hypothetical protein